MRGLAILKYEWIHLVRSPFKLVAILLFVLSAIYGLHNAAKLYHNQLAEIERIQSQTLESRAETLEYYDSNKKGPEGRPWVDLNTPFWAMWYTYSYHFKTPSPLIVYGVGQAEQFGYYKRVTFLSSPYDADMVEEIGNPERQQSGMLDFSFTVLILAPLLLLIFLYNIKGTEIDQGFYSLVQTQIPNSVVWLVARIAFYFFVIWLVMLGLMLYASNLAPVFHQSKDGFWDLFFWLSMYLLFWTVLFGLVLATGTSSISNTLKMVSLWLILVFVVPGVVHQLVSTKYPPNLMTDFIDAQRDEKSNLQALPDSLFQEKLNSKYPAIVRSKVMQDSTGRITAMNESAAALYNELNKVAVATIEASNSKKNNTIRSYYWINPVTYFQNRINRITQTHYDDYQNYRDQIQTIIDKQIDTMVKDIWNDKKIDKQAYLNYINLTND